MGHIYRVSLWNGKAEFVIKHVAPPNRKGQSFGDKRKADSYQVESNFYDRVASDLQDRHGLELPKPYLVERGPTDGEITICMSLLRGTPINPSNKEDVCAVLAWLAKFHSTYWGEESIDRLVQDVGVQAIGTYWHLDTRPEELLSMPSRGWEGRLKRAARAIDVCLKRDPMQCLIHGDAKEANILRRLDGSKGVAMYDFQYCGKGTPTKDLAYFLCSSADYHDEDELLLYYHSCLSSNLSNQNGVSPPTIQHLKDSLELSYSDFCRFMSGWGYWGNTIQDRVKKLLDRLDGGKDLGSDEAYEEAIKKEFW